MATFNPSLFESFDDYTAIMDSLAQAKAPAQNRPKAVLFGDSMSEYVGYNADGTPNNKYGNSIADVIGNNLGISVTNLATGGETSYEALTGGSKFGAFADYIAQNKPEYAIIRYGAADAIKNKDPNVTLQSIQQMVDIARANGVTPIIVGVSELYGAQNSKTGNIAGYIDAGAEQRANTINAGLAQLASRNGLAFTDVRSAVSAGQGDLLDGVHTNADFGKKMADAISESIVDQAAIQGINVPQLPPNVDALSNEEKGRLYNQLIDQGYSDAQIRTAAKSESDQDWNALKQIAASVKNTTPAAIERGTPAVASTPTTQSLRTDRPNLSYFGREGGWDLAAGAFVDPTRGRVYEPPSGVVFQRGNEVVVGDEIYWSPYAPVGDKLKQLVADNKSKGYRVGTVVSPYASLVGAEEGKGAKVGIKELASEVARSGVDFVAISPYIGWFGLKTPDLVNWSKDFLQEMKSLGKDTILVVQNDVPTSETSESEVIAHNKALMDLGGFSEYVAYSELPEGSRLYDFFNEYFQKPQAPAQEPPKAAAPTEPERRTALEAPSASQQQESPPSASVAAAQGGLTGQHLASKAEEVVANSGKANDPRFADSIVGTFTDRGVTYNVQGDGSFTTISETPDQVATTTTFTPEGQQVGTYVDERFKTTNLDRFLEFAANAALAAGTAAGLGPAGVGLFGAPAAAATGAGVTNLIRTGSVEEALKAAAIAGAGAYGTGQVLNTINQGAYDLSFAAADAAQLANQGLDAAAIAQNLSTYVDPTLASSLANTAANQAFALADATQLAQQGIKTDQIVQVLQASGVDATTAANMAGLAVDSVANPVIDASGKVVPPTINASDIVPDLKFQPQTRNPVQISTLPDSVTVTGQGVTGDLFNIPATSVGGLLSAANLPTLPEILQAATQQVQVAGQNQAAQTTTPEAVGGALAAVTPQVPTQQAATQQVQVPGQTAANNVDPDTASAVLSNLLGQPVTVQGGTQSVDVTGSPVGQTVTPEVAASLLSAVVGQQVVVQAPTVQAPTATPETVGSVLSSVIPTTPPAPPASQQVQVTGQGQQNLDADTASTMLSSLLGQPVAVQGSTQSVDVTGQTVQQTVAPETAAALLSAVVGQQVTVTGANIPPAPPTVPETAGGLLSSLITNQTVPVTGTNMGTTTTPETVGSVISSLVTPPPTQIVPVTGQTVQPPSITPTTVGSVVSALAPTQTVPVEDRSVKAQTTAPVIPVTPAEQVVVAGNRVVPVSEAVIPAGAAGAAAGVTAPKTTTTTDQSLFKPSDVLKLIGLLGGAGAGSALAGAGTGAGVGVPPSDTMLGSTTPQFGNDYYAAIQRYYNTYMPQTPRNVAGPLQQWYENKFGA